MAKRSAHSKSNAAQTAGLLLKSHYLGDDFPGLITSSNFAEYCTAHYSSLSNTDELLKRTTLFGTFSVPRTAVARRVLALPHPATQLALSCLIAKNRVEIERLIRSTNISLYSTKRPADGQRAFVGINFASREKKEAEILARHPVILKADIANFFHTVYSHSIPWAVLGKQHVKEVREGKDKDAKEALDRHWASRIDLAIQRGNSRETFGIPVGPDTSRIVAEILLAGIHKVGAFAKLIKDCGAYRLVDDFFIGFQDERDARRCLDTLRRALWEYNLHLNDTKTEVIRSSSIFDSGWKFEIEHFAISESSKAKQNAAIERLLEITLAHCAARRDWLPATFFCGRLLRLGKKHKNIEFLLDCMLRVGRDFTVCHKFVAQFVSQHREYLSDGESKRTISDWARHILSVHAKVEHDFEVAWVLIICGILRIPVDQSFIAVDRPVASPVVLAILGLLSAEGLLKEKWDDWRPSEHGTASIENGRNWLPCYEAVLREWTNDTSVISTIKSDPFFSQLMKANVTFLDDSQFKREVSPPSPTFLSLVRAVRRSLSTTRPYE